MGDVGDVGDNGECAESLVRREHILVDNVYARWEEIHGEGSAWGGLHWPPRSDWVEDRAHANVGYRTNRCSYAEALPPRE